MPGMKGMKGMKDDGFYTVVLVGGFVGFGETRL